MFFHFFFSCHGDLAAQNVLPGRGNVLTSDAAAPECRRDKTVQLRDRHRLSQVAKHGAAEVYIAVIAHPVGVERELGKRAEENGFVHQITNIDGEEKILGICNCWVCSCYALRTSQLFSTPNMSASAYRAHVDPEKCVACGQCSEVCPAGAAKLGQKLCTKEGDRLSEAGAAG